MVPQRDIEAELIDLGHTLAQAPSRPTDLERDVMARIAAIEARRTDELRVGDAPARRRWLLSAVAALVACATMLLPPVRAAVLDFFRIGGVSVQQGPQVGEPTVPATPEPSAAYSDSGDGIRLGSLAEAEGRLGVPVRTPDTLGAPEEIVLARSGEVLQLRWSESSEQPVLLEVFTGSPDWGYLKTVRDSEWTMVGGRQAVWIAAPHRLEWIDRRDDTRTATARLAGPTLVWTEGAGEREVTYRLEGPATLEEALALLGETADP